ncbi:Polymer-forming cytoskeletal [Caballeronia arationis]|jgi:cytoskeletal protein CcmA (bactofilin family)|uniref:Protein CcmA, bactofilin family n=1 Tax=Caballeronia arationis TaxID=1777142 RepID=A0A7Z7I3D5_9BURK|nr:polymer-forming cytoskeletal protein [Caballeronia arationis]SAK46466.1 Polymer-forming cytoskeletal [Caballeronia arationis]SOE58582.1 protein CcmA, bactofilin family [Caballeronia arationis]
MFAKKKSPGIQQAKLATLIAHDVHIKGNLEFSDGLRMDGQITGNVTGRPGEQTLLVVSDQGTITGNVSAYDIVINGTITGDVTVEHFVELQSNAHVNGNIYYQQLRMDVGASVEGKLTKREPAPPRPDAIADFTTD